MIKCEIKLFEKQEIEVKGIPAAIYAELVELITEILTRLNKEQRQKIESRLRNEATWKVINADVEMRKLNKE